MASAKNGNITLHKIFQGCCNNSAVQDTNYINKRQSLEKKPCSYKPKARIN